MYLPKLAHLTRTQAENLFCDQFSQLMAGPDEAAKRRAYYQFLDEKIKHDALPESARRWQYPFSPSPRATSAPDAPASPGTPA